VKYFSIGGKNVRFIPYAAVRIQAALVDFPFLKHSLVPDIVLVLAPRCPLKAGLYAST
jgi:hypothetical protein